MNFYTRKKYGYWTAYCPSLVLYATGDSKLEAILKLKQEITDHLDWETKYATEKRSRTPMPS